HRSGVGREPRPDCGTVRGGGQAQYSSVHTRAQNQGFEDPQESIQVPLTPLQAATLRSSPDSPDSPDSPHSPATAPVRGCSDLCFQWFVTGVPFAFTTAKTHGLPNRPTAG